MSTPSFPIFNKGADCVSYFTPAQDPPSGTAAQPQPKNTEVPKLFLPLHIRGVTFQNRIWLAPLCQYSAEDGKMTPWHMAHLGGIISRGPGFSMIEGVATGPEGRIDPNGVGLWNDSQLESHKEIVDFAHSQGQKIGIQLFHAGPKASSVAPWLGGFPATKDVGGWPDQVIGPSVEPYSETHHKPIAMTLKDIENFKISWVSAVERSVRANYDVIEIHAAHGFLLHSFLSPIMNTRTDEYGGSFANRTRLVLEIIKLTRQAIPETTPLFMRISATDWLENSGRQSWVVEDSVKLSHLAADLGVDLIDVSSGGASPHQKIIGGPGYQVPFSKRIKESVGDKVLVSAVGTIESGFYANTLLDEGLDTIFVGRGFQKHPGLVWAWAEELGVQIHAANQIRWGFKSFPGLRR